MSDAQLKINVAARVPCTEAEGPGRRFALWVQGCPLRCPGCCNPHMLAELDREWLTVEALSEELLATPNIEGLTLIGGEPFAQAEALGALAERARAAGLSVMVFSGFTLEQLKRSEEPGVARLLASTDLLVDGPYVATKPSRGRRWIGSENQRAHFLSERYAALRDSETGWDEGRDSIELRLRGDQLFINGSPHPALTALLNERARAEDPAGRG